MAVNQAQGPAIHVQGVECGGRAIVNLPWYDGAIMMAKTQIAVPPEQLRRAHAKAAALGISLAECFRRAMDLYLGEPPPRRDVSTVFDLFSSNEPSDIAHHKNEYIAEALEAEFKRKMGR